MTLVNITQAILSNENRIIPISVYNGGAYNIENDLYIGLPAILNRNGVKRVVSLKLDQEEDKLLKHSADTLKDLLDTMTF